MVQAIGKRIIEVGAVEGGLFVCLFEQGWLVRPPLHSAVATAAAPRNETTVSCQAPSPPSPSQPWPSITPAPLLATLCRPASTSCARLLPSPSVRPAPLGLITGRSCSTRWRAGGKPQRWHRLL